MPETIIQKPRVSATILGETYPIQTAQIHAGIGAILSFSITVSTSDAKEGGTYTISMIRELAAKMQKQIYSTPKQGNVKLSLSGYGDGSVSVEGVAISVALNATTSGGLSCTIVAAGNDSLMDMANFGVWTQYLNSERVQQYVASVNKIHPSSKVYVNLLPYDVQRNTSMPVAQRIQLLLNCGAKYATELNRTTGLNSEMTKAFNSMHEVNIAAAKMIGPFLSRSQKTTKLFNDEVNINEVTAKLVMEGLHESLFEQNYSFMAAILAICGDYRLWYVPRLSNKGNGILINQKYGDEATDGTINLYSNSFSFNCGGTWNSKPPCKIVTIKAQMSSDAKSEPVTTLKTPYSRLAAASYPEKPYRQFGTSYIYDAPGWLSLPVLELDQSKAISDKTINDLKGGTTTAASRDYKNIAKTAQASVQAIKKNIDSNVDILKYLAKKTYCRTILQPSTATINGPFNGRISAEPGDMVTVNVKPGSKLVSGIVSDINISVSPTQSTVSINIMGAYLPGVRLG